MLVISCQSTASSLPILIGVVVAIILELDSSNDHTGRPIPAANKEMVI